MGKCVIGDSYTFTILFLDDAGQKFDPDIASIEVFYFDTGGTKVSIVPEGTLMDPVPSDASRYKLTMLVPNTLTPSTQIYGVMTGEILSRGVKVVSEEIVDLFYGEDCDKEVVYIDRGLKVSFTRPK